MKLLYSPTSPYVREVTVTAIECGLDSKIERVPGAYREPASSGAVNPLGKVPALIRDDGKVLIDSPVICEYLDTLAGGRKVIPAGEGRWAALHLQALADGILDAAVLVQTERNRPEGERSAAQLDKQTGKVQAGLDSIERDMAVLAGPLNIGQIALGSVLITLAATHLR
jgi:glutathione S-transferase